ncbi:hypothetical protein [Sphingomonas morindae]|uniref:DUF4345 domain-containing protein n=1 Tax=Sphingomonas morindae TaxID=1541170 RepID=A0ABY4X9N5_9SPHN|nr:hypothetical protein [Sphingomonas morindae]USI73677.1 hypothetical protein LHA26_04175 [Sphingomonas morindae]
MRPISITRFAILYAAGIALGAGSTLLHWSAIRAALASASRPGFLATLLALCGLSVPLLLLWLIAARGSDGARWLALLLLALGVALLLFGAARGTYRWDAAGLLGAGRLALHCLALAFTFRPDARAWLAPGRRLESA